MPKGGTILVWILVTRPHGGLVVRATGTGWEDQRLVLALYPGLRLMCATADGERSANSTIYGAR